MTIAARWAQFDEWFTKKQFGADARIDFYESLSALLENRKLLIDALSTLHRNASEDGKKPKAPAAVMLYDCRMGIQAGHAFSEVISKWVPAQEAALMAAGEKAGDLVSACAAAAQTIADTREMVGAALKALLYPLFLLVGLFVVIGLMSYGVVPDLLKQGPVEAWKGPTYLMVRMGVFVQHFGPLLLALIIAFVTSVVISMPLLGGQLRDRLDRYPPWSVYRVLMGTGFLLNVATMLTAGVRLEETLVVLIRHANPYVRERIEDTLRGIRLGLNLGDALKNAEHNFPSPRSVRFLQDLASEKGFDQVLARFARRELARSTREIAMRSALLRVVLIVLLGVVICVFFLGVMGIAQAGRASFGH